MAALLGDFVPLALAAIAPVMFGVIVVILSTESGLAKALAFLSARFVGYAIWGVVFLMIGGAIGGSDAGPSQIALIIKTVLGVLLLVLAAKTFFSDEDPDAPPPKWMSALDNASALALFGIGLLLTAIQVRFVILMLVGVSAIDEAGLGSTGVIVAMLVLILAATWIQILPVLLYLVMGSRAESILDSMNSWLSANASLVNSVVLLLFGAILLWDGLTGLGGV